MMHDKVPRGGTFTERIAAPGQQRRFRNVRDESAYPPITALKRTCPRVAFVPLPVVSSRSRRKLFDHLVGAGEQRRGQGEGEGFRRLQVDQQFEFSGLINRNVARLRTFEDFVRRKRRAMRSPHPFRSEAQAELLDGTSPSAAALPIAARSRQPGMPHCLR
jgi:hypothetical protein